MGRYVRSSRSVARSRRTASDRFKVEMMLKPVGLIRVSEGRIFSSHEMPRSKPHPDVYLAAAAHLQIDPARCLVIEDTTVGITAGVAAGATV
jgi:beta-phosphoglucomutase-like phosphatase (HAD superfamily)